MKKKIVNIIENNFVILSILILFVGVSVGIINFFNVDYIQIESDSFGFSNLFSLIIKFFYFFDCFYSFLIPVYISVIVVIVFYIIKKKAYK